jgi:arabinofuranosyltransferase
MSDDGYINVRIVSNVLNGHGPVFNPGERVEAGTSPLWIAMLVVARLLLWFVDPAWVAVSVGIALTLVGIGCAIAGARRWWASLGEVASLPLGAGVLLALPPMWDFASSGLETGLAFAWLGACWWALAARLAADDPPPLHRPRWLPVLIGLGPLVRPDLVLFTLGFAVALVATSSVTRANVVRALGLGLALPGIYQVFRMGYYGILVPNTALAKEAGRSLWGRGLDYLNLYMDGTLIWVPLLLLGLLLVVTLWRVGPSRRHLVVAGAPILGGLLHATYVTRVGGDFMFGRMLLFSTFAAVCPLAAQPMPRRVPQWALAVPVVVSLALIGMFQRYQPGLKSWTTGVADERVWWVVASGNDHPVTLHDFDNTAYVRWRDPAKGMVLDIVLYRTAPAHQTVVAFGSIGVLGASLPSTHIADTLSLAEPVGSHFPAGPTERPGHEKHVDWDWIVARYGVEPLPTAETRDAHAALQCGDLAELVDSVSDPLTPGRFLDNLFGSVDRTLLRVPSEPGAARAEFCGDSAP